MNLTSVHPKTQNRQKMIMDTIGNISKNVKTLEKHNSVSDIFDEIDLIIGREERLNKNLSGKYGFKGNATDAYITLPITLNGKYDVEFLYKNDNMPTLNRVLDFRKSGGTGYVSTNSALALSSGTAYINHVLGGIPENDKMNLIEVRAMDLICTEVVVLASNSYTDPAIGLISDLRIYDHYTGEMICDYPLDKSIDGKVWDVSGNNEDGSVFGTGSHLKYTDEYLSSYTYIANEISKRTTPLAMLTLDDGHIEVRTIIGPLLKERDMTANIGVNSIRLPKNEAAYMNLEDAIFVRDEYGLSIVNHTTTHKNIRTLLNAGDTTQATYELKDSMDYLNSYGFDGDCLIFAESNGYSPKAAEFARELGFVAARIPSVSLIQDYPPKDLLALVPLSTNDIHNESVFRHVSYMIDKAIASGSLLITYNHNVKEDADAATDGYSNVTGKTNFTHMLNRLKNYNCRTLTMKELSTL